MSGISEMTLTDITGESVGSSVWHTRAVTRSEVTVYLSNKYSFVLVEDLPKAAREEIQALFETHDTEALLLPRDNTSHSVVPLNHPRRRAFEAIIQGCSWNEAVSGLSCEEVERLFALGMLYGQVGSLSLTGPALPLMMREDCMTRDLPSITTDVLSAQCISHASRMPISDLGSLITRLYLYNHVGVYGSDRLNRATQDVARIISRPMPTFSETPPPPINPGWHFFNKVEARSRRISANGAGYKIYLSPSVDDTARCLSQFIELLPLLRCHGWKVGRGSFGIARPDKICLYFDSEADATAAAAILGREIHGIETHGIPFTRSFDTTGLISLGQDPPTSQVGASVQSITSWRDWVTKKLAAALLLARSTPDSPLSAEQSALWTIKILGVDPSSWRVEDKHFWRN